MSQTEYKNTISVRLWVRFSVQTCEKVYGNLKLKEVLTEGKKQNTTQKKTARYLA